MTSFMDNPLTMYFKFLDEHQALRNVSQGEHQRGGDVPGRDRARPQVEARTTKSTQQPGDNFSQHSFPEKSF